MTIAIGGHTATAGSATSSAITTTGGSGTVFAISVGWYGTVSITGLTGKLGASSDGNTYTQVGSTVAGVDTSFKTATFECVGGAGGASHTFIAAFSGSPTLVAVIPVEVTGTTTSSPRDQAPAILDDNTSPYTSNTTGTTSQADEIAITFFHTYTNTAGPEVITRTDGYTALDTMSDPAVWTGGSAYKVLTATGTQQSSFTSSGAGTNDALSAIITYKAAAGGTPTPKNRRSLLGVGP